MDHHRCVQIPKRPPLDEDDLSPAALLARCAQNHQCTVEFRYQPAKSVRDADRARPDQIVTARMSHLRERVVLRQNSDPRALRSTRTCGPERGLQFQDPGLHLQTRSCQLLHQPRACLVLSHRELRMRVDLLRQLDQPFPVCLDLRDRAVLHSIHSGHRIPHHRFFLHV